MADSVPVAHDRLVRLWRWRDGSLCVRGGDLAEGTSTGTAAGASGIVLATPVGVRSYRDPHGTDPPRDYEYAHWTSPQVVSDFPATEAITWWQATTPPGTWIEVAFRPVRADALATPWYVMSRWASNDGELHPTTVGGQTDRAGAVNADEYVAADLTADTAGGGVAAATVRVTLYRRVGSAAETPTLHAVGATFSHRARRAGDVSSPGPSAGLRLAVPAYSQRLHARCYPQWNGGGNTWCSPTSTAMVLAFFRRLPPAGECAWVDAGCVNPVVPHAVRGCFDYSYNGAGNWTFNTAYTTARGLTAFVTRLRSVSEAERFIAAGIPLVASVRVTATALAGAGYNSRGHLLVVTGTTDAGDVVVNDPAAATDAEVPRVYDRRQFEAAWLGGSGGVVYVIHPPDVALPPAPAQPNW